MMKHNHIRGVFFLAMISILMAVPSIAHPSMNNRDLSTSHTDTYEPANAPWFFDTVETFPPDPPSPAYDVGQHVSIALHPESGRPFISYYESSHQDLMMAEYLGSGFPRCSNPDWQCEIIDGAGNAGQYSSITFNPTSKQPIISYYSVFNGNRALKLAFRTFTGWTIKTIHKSNLSNIGKYTSVKRGATTNIGISYYLENFPGVDGLWYAKYVGSGGTTCDDPAYDCTQVDYGEGIGKYSSLALDSADRPHIAYYDQGNDALKYAHYNGSWIQRWILSTDSAGKFASLVIDTHNGDKPHVAHYGSIDGKLKYATFVGAPNGNCGTNQYTQFEWQCDDIDDMGISSDPRGISIAVDQNGYPIISYQSGGSGLKMARPVAALGFPTGNCGEDPDTHFYMWRCEGISLGYGFGQGDYLSLVVNSAGLSTIAYYGNIVGPIGDLKVAYQRLEIYTPAILRNAVQH